jgi:hypothetical protein
MRHAWLAVAVDFDHEPHRPTRKFGFRDNIDAVIGLTGLANERHMRERKLGYGPQEGLERLCRLPFDAVRCFHRFAETMILMK